jgi:hypothetical protein
VRRTLRATLTCGLLAVVLTGCAREERVPTLPGNNPAIAEVGVLEAIALYVLLPLVILIVTAALVWLPGMLRGSRYRPGAGWSAPPVWFAGPPDPAAAVENAEIGDVARGGASGSW